MTTSRPSIAIAHDYVTQRGGAERVVLAMLRAFPDATLHTLLYDPEATFPEFRDYTIVTSPLNRIPVLRRNHRLAFPLLAAASSRMVIDADIVIVSSSGWAHGMQINGASLVYCHSPARWLYQPRNYLGAHAGKTPIGWLLLAMTPYLKRWDRRAARRATRYLANSRVVRDRIHAAYGIDAAVLPAPFGVDAEGSREPVHEVEGWASEGYHLIVSRLMPYKNVGPAIDAFASLPDERLVIVGNGPLREQLIAQCPANVRLVSDLNDSQMRWIYAHAQALVAPSLEDYGLTPLEASAVGIPTIALGAGGYLDTVVPGLNGLFFEQPTPELIAAAVRDAGHVSWDPHGIREHARRFDEANFGKNLRDSVTDMTP